MQKYTYLLVLALWGTTAQAQDFMMQAWYWNYPKGAWANNLNTKASSLGTAGFTEVWVPPLARASFGNNSNGYDPKDLYDFGEYGGGATGVGTRAEVDAMISAFTSAGIHTVADMVYNHRDGGKAEQNEAVKSYITTHYTAAKEPFPSDRVRCAIPLGGSSGNGVSNYYLKISSKTGDNRFVGKNYKIYCWTNKVGYQGLTDSTETEPNGGGDCGQPSNAITLGRNFLCTLDIGGSCNTDEFLVPITASDFFSTDTLFISLQNTNGYSDHRIYGVWQANPGQDIVSQVQYQTYTNFNDLPSAQGGMNFENFKPNTANAPSTFLNGDWDSMLFFYDYDQNQQNTKDVLNAWTKWNWNDVGIRGFRMDAVKHFPPAFVTQLNTYLENNGIAPNMFVGEYFDLGAANLRNWVNSVPSNVKVFDFALRDAFKKASDCFGYDVRNVFNAGMVGWPINDYRFRSVTFVNNHDLREGLSGNGGCSGDDYDTPIQNDPMLAYAYILTNNQIGVPCVFYPDYYGASIPNAPVVNLKVKIDSLIKIHKDYIYGSPDMEYLSRFSTPYGQYFVPGFGQPSTTLVYQMHGGVGGKDIIVAINYAGTKLDMYQVINTAWGGGPGTPYKNLIGNAPASTNITNSNELHIEVPARSYSIWARDFALPVQVIDFKVIPQKNDIELHWTIGDQTGQQTFEVERLVEGQSFQTIGSVPATTEKMYAFTDHNAPKGTNLYYRLKINEAGNETQYSNVLQTKLLQDKQHLVFFPNPASHRLFLKTEEASIEPAVWKILDSQGTKVVEWEGTFPEAGLDLSLLPKGMYRVVKIDDLSTYSSANFIKN